MESKKTMKAVVFEEYKAWDQFDLTPVTVPVPTPKATEVLVKIKAAAINPIDIMVATGALKAFGWAQPSPYTPGYDLSGVVEAVGSDVKDFKAGDEVFSVNWSAAKGQPMGKHDDEGAVVAGTFAEYIAIPAEKLSKKDSKVSHEEAAAIALVGTTAMQSLRLLKLSAGEKVLILGGAGAVGHLAIQIAKSWGYKVYTTASSRTKAYVEEAGPDGIIDYRKEKWEESKEIKGIDAVFDAIGEKGCFANSKKVVKEGGSFVTISAFEPSLLKPDGHKPAFRHASFYCLMNNPKDQDILMEMMIKKQLKVTVSEKFEFTKEGITNMFKKQASGKSMGKNVLVF